MRNITLVDYLKKIRTQFDSPPGEKSLHDSAVVADANATLDCDWSPTYQKEYYLASSFSKEFTKVMNDLNGFVSKYPNIPKQLLTVSQDNDSGFSIVKASSDDEKEVYEWEQAWNQNVVNVFDIKIPFHTRILYQNSRMLNASGTLYIATNPNWRELSDPLRTIEYPEGGIWRDDKFYSDQNQSPMDILSACLSNKELIFESDHGSGLEHDLDYGEGARVLSLIQYPALHPRIKTYLGLLKKFFGLVLKIEGIKYNAIDIIPIDNNDIAIYVATNSAEDINAHYKVLHEIKNDVNYLTGNIMSRISSAYDWLDFQGDDKDTDIDEDDWTNDSFFFSFYKRDRSLRFQSIISSRLNRITSDIHSLNKLHNPTNYKFLEGDFISAFNIISATNSRFRKDYEKYFSTKKISKTKQELLEEIELLKKISSRKMGYSKKEIEDFMATHDVEKTYRDMLKRSKKEIDNEVK